MFYVSSVIADLKQLRYTYDH